MTPNFADLYERRRLLMLGGGGLGGILGSILGGLVAPELLPAFVPAALATAGGAELGGTLGGVAGGEKIGQAALGALPGAATAGIGTGLTNLASSGDFLGSVTPLSGISSLPSGGGASAGAASGAAAAPVTAGGGAGGAVAPTAAVGATPAAGTAVGSPAGIGAGVGSSPANIGGALETTPILGPSTTTGVGGGGSFFQGALNTSGLTNNPPASEISTAPTTLTQSLGTSAPLTSPDVAVAGPQDFTGGGGGGVFGVSGAGGVTQDASGGSFTPPSAGSQLASDIERNPGLLLAGGGLLEAISQGNSIPGIGALKTQAGLEAGQGNQNLQALQTGALPAGAQAGIDEAAQAAKAQISSQFARLGLTGSTSETEALASVDQQAASQKFNDLMSVSQLGLQEVGGANSLYSQIMQSEIQSDQQTQDAIARLAAALAGSTGAVRGATGTTTPAAA